MSREIKFHGKCKDDEKWYCGSLLKMVNDYFIIAPAKFNIQELDPIHAAVFEHRASFGSEKDFYSSVAVYPVYGDSVRQFTGFKDSYNREIYEGDILLNNAHAVNFVYRVEWHTDCWVGVRKGDAELLGNLIDAMSLKIIGNVFDNPELLEGGDNNAED